MIAFLLQMVAANGCCKWFCCDWLLQMTAANGFAATDLFLLQMVAANDHTPKKHHPV